MKSTVKHHVCHAINCDKTVDPKYLFCRFHWEKLSDRFKRRIWKTYKQGQEKTKTPSLLYVKAHYASINYIAAREGQKLIDIRKKVNIFLRK